MIGLRSDKNSDYGFSKVYIQFIYNAHLSNNSGYFVKSATAGVYCINPQYTFSANIQHNFPMLFCISPTYLPAGLAFRSSFQKQIYLHFYLN